MPYLYKSAFNLTRHVDLAQSLLLSNASLLPEGEVVRRSLFVVR